MNTGLFLPIAEVTENQDGTYTIWLSETMEPDGGNRTAPSARYTVDAYGEGKDEITEEHVSLMR